MAKFFSIRTNQQENIQLLLKGERELTIGTLNWYRDKIKPGAKIFFVLSGDESKKRFPYANGLRALGEVTKGPLPDKNNNYKIEMKIFKLFSKSYTKRDFYRYMGTLDVPHIGPETKSSPNQAIGQLTEGQAESVLFALKDMVSENEKSEIDSFWGREVKRGTKFLKIVGDQPPQGASEGEFNINPEEVEELLFFLKGVDTKRISRSISAALKSGMHIILIGPPGTGKTQVGYEILSYLESIGTSEGFISTTATASWTTFDTIGGLVPSETGELVFKPGIFLSCFRDKEGTISKNLLIDEINRADIDKAFGHFFTVLSGQDVVLPYKGEKGKSIFISQTSDIQELEVLKEKFDLYFISPTWRMFCTMNSEDKASLFSLSYAFMRRFAFIHIPGVERKDLPEFISNIKKERDLKIEPEAEKKILNILDYLFSEIKIIGPALIIDFLEYLHHSRGYPNNILDAFSSFVLPQLEGPYIEIFRDKLKDGELKSFFNQEELEALDKITKEFEF